MTAIRNNTQPSQKADTAAELDAKLEQWVKGHQPLLEVLLDAYCVVDLANKVVDFNVAFTELCGESYRKIKKIGHFCELVRTKHCEDQCPAKQVVTSQKSIRLDELDGSSKAYPNLSMILGGVPIFGEQGEVLGSLITIRNVSAESELQKKYDERKKESITDGLTRLYNKVFTEAYLLRVIKGSLREETRLTVVMCDIDHFKKVNDTYGHQAGDYVLSTVAKLMVGESRDTDVIGRFGGEEFTAILSNTDYKGARIFCERYRKKVESTEFVFDGKKIPVTISLGTATFTELWKPGMRPEDEMRKLVGRADIALYEAKASGRNQTCQFETLPDEKKNKELPPKKPG